MCNIMNRLFDLTKNFGAIENLSENKNDGLHPTMH